MPNKLKRRIGTFCFHFFVCGLGFIMIYPLIWMIFSSFKASNLVLSTVGQLFPSEWRFDNYVNGWSGFGGTTFEVFFKNSFIVTIKTIHYLHSFLRGTGILNNYYPS